MSEYVTESNDPIWCRGGCGSNWTVSGWNMVSNWGVRYDYTCYICVGAAEYKARQGRLFR